MSDDNQEIIKTKEEEVKTYTEEQYAELQEKVSITEANLEKSRKGEKFYKAKSAEFENKLKEVPDATELQTKLDLATKELDGLKTASTNALIDTALKAEIEKAGGKAASTVLKLVDRSKIVITDGQVDTKSIEEAVSEVKKTDAVLFDTTQKVPPVKLPGTGNVTDAFKTELKAAKNQKELTAVYTKYGIGVTI